MNKLNEIFKTNKSLLDEPEVKELVLYFENQYNKMFNAYTKLDDLEFKITHECMISELIIKDGKNAKDALEAILKLLNNNA